MKSSEGFGNDINKCTNFEIIKDFIIVTLPKRVKLRLDQTLINFSHLLRISCPFKSQMSSTFAENITPNIFIGDLDQSKSSC
jgi:hypothetical protein